MSKITSSSAMRQKTPFRNQLRQALSHCLIENLHCTATTRAEHIGLLKHNMALCSGAKHNSNRASALYACALYQFHISLLQANTLLYLCSFKVTVLASSTSMPFYYLHISKFVSFHVSVRSLLVTCMLKFCSITCGCEDAMQYVE